MFSVAITAYNRTSMVLRASESAIRDPLCRELVIVDDCSEPEQRKQLRYLVRSKISDQLYGVMFAPGTGQVPIRPNNPLNIIYEENAKNLGMARNKEYAISLCKFEHVLILDSDNYILPEFLTKAFEFIHLENTLLMPERALPEFIYSEFAGRIIDKNNVKEFLDAPMFQVLLNTGNYIVPRIQYKNVFSYNPDIKETDTLWFNYLWLKAGFKFFVVPGMDYIHEVHSGSGWLRHADYNTEKAKEIIGLLHQL